MNIQGTIETMGMNIQMNGALDIAPFVYASRSGAQGPLFLGDGFSLSVKGYAVSGNPCVRFETCLQGRKRPLVGALARILTDTLTVQVSWGHYYSAPWRVVAIGDENGVLSVYARPPHHLLPSIMGREFPWGSSSQEERELLWLLLTPERRDAASILRAGQGPECAPCSTAPECCDGAGCPAHCRWACKEASASLLDLLSSAVPPVTIPEDEPRLSRQEVAS